MSSRSWVLVVAVAAAAVACGRAGPAIDAAPAPSASPVPSGSKSLSAADCGRHRPAPVPDELGRKAVEIRRWAEQQAPDTFAGAWPDDRADRVITVAFTRDVERLRRMVRDRFDADVAVVEADHSLSELRSLQDAIAASVEEQFRGNPAGQMRPGSAMMMSVDERDNRVRIGVLEPDGSHRRELAQRWGADRICIEPMDIPDAEDARPAGWVVASDADLSAGSTRIEVLVREFACAGGDDAHGRIVPPAIDYRDDAVVITIEVIPKPGPQECPLGRDTPFTVELDEPLDGRQLLDGRNDPPTIPSLEYRSPA